MRPGIDVGRVLQGDRRAAACACGVDARSVDDGDGLAVDRMEAPRGAESIGELAADVGDLICGSSEPLLSRHAMVRAFLL